MESLVQGSVEGSVEIQELGPGVVLYKMHGYLDAPLVPRFAADADVHARAGLKVDLFFDTATMTGNSPAFRRRMTDWHNALKPQTRSLSVLVHSRIIAMSIAVVNLFTGSMLKSYASRVAFEAAIRAALGARHRS